MRFYVTRQHRRYYDLVERVAEAEGWEYDATGWLTIASNRLGQVVGFHRFEVEKYAIDSLGTWVRANYRRRGIALRLWERTLRSTEKKTVYVDVITRRGQALVTALMRKYPDVEFFGMSTRLSRP